jgi:hypothetical protein
MSRPYAVRTSDLTVYLKSYTKVFVYKTDFGTKGAEYILRSVIESVYN